MQDLWSEGDSLLQPPVSRGSGNKRRRRAPFVPDLHTPQPPSSSGDETDSETEVEKTDISSKGDSNIRRKMQSAVPSMSVKEERKALQEIRSITNPRPHMVLQCNGMTVGAFALQYVVGHHLKRKTGKVVKPVTNKSTGDKH